MTPLTFSLNPFLRMNLVYVFTSRLRVIIWNMSCYWHRLLPVFHQSDLPLAGDLFRVLRRRALHGARGRRHHDALGQARVGRTQLVGGYVSCGSYRRERRWTRQFRTANPATFPKNHISFQIFQLYSITLCFFTFSFSSISPEDVRPAKCAYPLSFLP